MSPTMRNILAVIAGWIVGSIVNMGVVKAGHSMMPIPDIDPNDMDALAAAFKTLDFKYFVPPFLAHALGTLVGAAVAAYLAVNQKLKMALVVGAIFFFGGLAVNYMIQGPLWFSIADILLAYIPMAWIGGKLMSRE